MLVGTRFPSVGFFLFSRLVVSRGIRVSIIALALQEQGGELSLWARKSA